ncbi:hypothetical protein JT55_10030 [Rhodovulum sp. NI22]|nr:hypothetical protein JT55_10030 [Rhodovulum sp. NI22]
MQAPTDAANTYISNEVYAALRAELVRLIAEQPYDPDTAIVTALGEVGGVWPESVRDDTECPVQECAA